MFIVFIMMLFILSITLNASAISIKTSNITTLEDVDFENYKRWHHIQNNEEFKLSKEVKTNKNVIPGEILVQFKNQLHYSSSPEEQIITGIASIDDLNEQFGVHNVKQLLSSNSIPGLQNLYKFYCADNLNPAAIAKLYNDDPNVLIAEANYVYEYNIEPNDPRFSSQWSLYQYNDIDIDATDAWEITTGSSDVVVAVIDSGVDSNHPDLKNNLLTGWNFLSDSTDTSDIAGHGTLCSGLIAAEGNNDIGIAGLSWNSKILPLKTGNLNGCIKDLCLEAICYAADNNADIISISWGSDDYSRLQKNAIDYAYNKGVLIVAAAGNNYNSDELYPAALENVISVAATDKYDNKPGFSSYGDWVDVAAPGVDILSTYPIFSYQTHSGTSFSAPIVAGVAALILSENPNFTPDMVRAKIRNGVDALNTQEYIGTGRINAYKALTMNPIYSFINPVSNWDDVKGVLKIQGSADCENFKSYKIEIGQGETPKSWEVIKTSSQKVVNNELASLNTLEFTDGMYIIKLTVETIDTDFYTDSLTIIVNNLVNQNIYVDASNTAGPWDGTEQHPFRYFYDGINSAANDETLIVKKGTYYPPADDYGYRKGNYVINRKINIVGEDNENTIICHDRKQAKWMFELLIDNVEISGLKIVTITDEYDWEGGAFLIQSDGNYIHDNTIVTVEGGGAITIESSSNNVIENNIVTSIESRDCWRGICLVNNCYDNQIIDNTITKQYNCGIGLWDGCENNLIKNNIVKEGPGSGTCYGIIVLDYCDTNTVENNEIRDIRTDSSRNYMGCMIIENAVENKVRNNIFADSKGNGLWMYFFANNNIISNNVFENIELYGVHVDHSWTVLILFQRPILCRNNEFYGNSFKNNGLGNARDDGSDTWYQFRNGNFWDDYDGNDINNDGIGEADYIIPGVRILIKMGLNSDEEILRIPITHKDKYPLIEESDDDSAKSTSINLINRLFDQDFFPILKNFYILFKNILNNRGIV